jgi:hypothetical protein
MARIGTRALSQFCQRVGTALHAGIDVRRVWDNESKRGSAPQRGVMEGIRQQVARGDSLASAFARTNGYFPPLVCEMVEVGERTGRLEEVFLRLGEHYDHLLNLRRAFLIGIAWPLIELTLAVIAIGFFILLYGWLGLRDINGEPMTIFGLYGTQGLAQRGTGLSRADHGAGDRGGAAKHGTLALVLVLFSLQ